MTSRHHVLFWIVFKVALSFNVETLALVRAIPRSFIDIFDEYWRYQKPTYKPDALSGKPVTHHSTVSVLGKGDFTWYVNIRETTKITYCYRQRNVQLGIIQRALSVLRCIHVLNNFLLERSCEVMSLMTI